MKKAQQALLLLYIILYIGIPTNGVEMILGFNIHVIILVLLVLFSLGGTLSFPWKKQCILTVFLFVFFAVSYVTIPSYIYYETSKYGNLMNLLQFAVFLVILYQSVNKNNLNLVLLAWVCGGLLNTLLLVLGQVLGLGFISFGGFNEDRLVIAGRDANEMAIILCFCLSICIYLIKKKKWVIFNYCFIPFAVYAILFSGSRTALLAILMSIVVLLFYGNLSQGRNTFWRNLFLFVFIGIAFHYIYTIIPETLLERYLGIGDEITEGSMANRKDIWESCFSVFVDSSFIEQLLGHGYNMSLILMKPLFGRLYDAHNIFLKVLLEYGVMGEILLLYYVYTLFAHVYKLSKQKMDEKKLLLMLISPFLLSGLSLSWIYNLIFWVMIVTIDSVYRNNIVTRA